MQRLRLSLEMLEPRPERVLVGFSGGADSLAALALLRELDRLGDVRVSAVHVDHSVREESASDVARVAAAADALGMSLAVRTVPPELLSRHSGVGREEAMRRERYRQFALAIEDSGADLLVLAHHQGDQAETVLLHLLRGSGLQGASGMRSRSSLIVPWWEEPGDTLSRTIEVWRPLLGGPARALRDLAESLRLPIVEDASNSDETYRRNAIRHSVVPLLEEISPGATANLARFAGLAAEDCDELDRQAQELYAAWGEPAELDAAELRGVPLALRRRILRIWLARCVPVGLEIPLHRIEAVLRIVNHGAGGREIEIGQGVSVVFTGGSLEIRMSSS